MSASGLRLTGEMVNNRYEIKGSISRRWPWEMFLAFDRVADHDVVLELVRHESWLPWTRNAEDWVRLAQRVRHPNVCRVHGIENYPGGTAIVTEYVPGRNLHTVFRARKANGGMTADEFRSIAAGLFSGLAAIHGEKVVHCDIKPGKMIIAADRAVIHHFWFAEPAENAGSPYGGTPNYMSPERLQGGDASFEDDVYAMALTLWEAFTCRVPEPGYQPRAQPMRQELVSTTPAALLTTRELRQFFLALDPDPRKRPCASQMRFDPMAPDDQLGRNDDDDRLFNFWIGQNGSVGKEAGSP